MGPAKTENNALFDDFVSVLVLVPDHEFLPDN